VKLHTESFLHTPNLSQSLISKFIASYWILDIHQLISIHGSHTV